MLLTTLCGTRLGFAFTPNKWSSFSPPNWQFVLQRIKFPDVMGNALTFGKVESSSVEVNFPATLIRREKSLSIEFDGRFVGLSFEK